mmetsp:Transcript_40770/g.118959  ORF Transcript_40770/g.118959 Transcript_40770/m.118959 type:complete len:182 (+) Transcript_40770:85-630(+)
MTTAVLALPTRVVPEASVQPRPDEGGAPCEECAPEEARGGNGATGVPTGTQYQAEFGESECAVCLEAFQPGEVLRLLPCFHSFHQPCIDAWLLKGCGNDAPDAPEMRRRRVCPLCKRDPTKPVVIADPRPVHATGEHTTGEHAAGEHAAGAENQATEPSAEAGAAPETDSGGVELETESLS